MSDDPTRLDEAYEETRLRAGWPPRELDWTQGIMREIVGRRAVEIELRPSHDARLEAYRERFVGRLGTDPLELADVTADELIVVLLEAALERDEHRSRLGADQLGVLHPYPYRRQAWNALTRTFRRLRNRIARALP